MLTLIRNLDARSIKVELPAFAGSLLMAEFLFKFHSFTLECLAFLGTWAFLSYCVHKLKM